MLLNLGHAEAYCWAQTFVYVLSTCLMGVILILIVLQRDLLRPSDSLVAGSSLAILPLIFGGGLIFTAPMLMWLTYRATRLIQIPGRLRNYGLATLSLVGVSAAMAQSAGTFTTEAGMPGFSRCSVRAKPPAPQPC